MTKETSWNLLVFRDAARTMPARDLLVSLRARIAQAALPGATADEVVGALLAAGELESAIADAGAAAERALRKATDFAALRLVAPGLAASQPIPNLRDIELPSLVRVSPHEGFAYYALHPADFAAMALKIPISSSAAIIGIRSIGATLSAVVAATLNAKGVSADRITVRPTGHPYDRRTEFGVEQQAWVRAHRCRGSQFLVVDEGPGISGSSFLSVAKALMDTGVPSDSITFVCSRRPDPAQLRAPAASRRWPEFRALYLESPEHLPAEAAVSLAGGQWRRVFLPPSYDWPASWTSMERCKFLSEDRRWFLKFEGLGRYGDEVRHRGQMLAQARFSPMPDGGSNGFTRYGIVPGNALAISDLSQDVLDRIAQYCAFRHANFASTAPATDLHTMVRHNLEQEFGPDSLSSIPELVNSRTVIADSRMMPHDWVRSSDGHLLKMDNTCHGDDHFFPGPTSIAWDLAGAIVEWHMNSAAAEYLINQYCRCSGDFESTRGLPGYLLAYSVCRMAYCRMASAAMAGQDEQFRLQRAYEKYRNVVSRHIARACAAPSVLSPASAGRA